MKKEISIGLMLMAGASCASSTALPAEPQKPNVIFILTDDQGWGDLGCYGHPYLRTPNLDRLARQGMLLESFYISSPVCSPSRASFLTGRYPGAVGLPHIIMRGEQREQYGTSEYLDPSLPTISRFLQQAGYATGNFGKWHLGFTDGPPIRDYGFDESITAQGNGPQLPLYESRNDADRREFRARSTELIIDASIDFIERHQDQPFYAQVWTIVPHSPLVPTEEQLAAYPHLAQPRYIPHVSARHIYYAMMTDLDYHVGRLLQRLDELGLADNTIVMFSSDNGPEHHLINNAGYSAVGSTGPFRGMKRSLYEGGIRVPFIARWPGRIPAGAVNRHDVVMGIDYLATVAGLCGITLPEDLVQDGEDRSAILLGRSEPRQAPVMWEWRSRVFAEPHHQSPRLALRDGPWKFLMNADRSRQELYHIEEDYGEMNNLAKEHPELVERYARQLEDFARSMPPGPVQPGAGERDFRVPPHR